MLGRSQLAMLASLALAAGNRLILMPGPTQTAGVPANRKNGLFNRKAAPTIYLAGSYPRKDRMNTAAQHKRASTKARNVAKHRRHA